MKTRLIVPFLTLPLASISQAALSSAEFSAVFNVRDVDANNYQGSLFYLNDNINEDGHLLAGQIGWGAWEINPSGAAVNMIQTNQTLTQDNTGVFFDDTTVPIGDRSVPIGAKSVVQIGNYNFMAANNHAGIARFANQGPGAWDPAATNISGQLELGPNGQLRTLTDGAGNAFASESLTVDGSLLISNESSSSGNTARVHAFNVQNFLDDFTLNHAWTADVTGHPDLVNTQPRFRGIANGSNGFAYGVDTGNGGSGSVWAFDLTDGTPTKVIDYLDPADTTGSDVSFLGETYQGFASIVHDGELWVAGTGGFISSFDLTSPTSVDPASRVDVDFTQLLVDAGAAEEPADPNTDPAVAIYGIAAEGETLWVSYESKGETPNRRVAVFDMGNAVVIQDPLPGDVDLDGEVGFVDYLIFQGSYDGPGGWNEGDFDGDGWVGFTDYLLMQANFGNTESSPSLASASLQIESFAQALSIPEPGTLAILTLGAIGWVRRRPGACVLRA